MATASPQVNEGELILESKRIINAHWRHFLALSVLFLLPPCSFVTVYGNVFRLIIDQSAASHNEQPLRTAFDDTQTVVLFLIAYIVVVIVFNLLAIGSIAYSIYQGFHGRPVKLISSLKSSFKSFFPLLATLISSNFIVLGILLILGFATFLLTQLIKLILPDLEFEYFFLSLFSVVITSAYVIVTKLYIDWILAWVIVVFESTWGLTPLKRSKNLINGLRNKILIKEMRRNSLFIIFIFMVTHLNFVWNIQQVADSAQINNNNGETGKLWTNAFDLVRIVIMSVILTFITLYNMASMAVSYIQCKAVHDDLACEIAGEYVSLPFDDGKVPYLVSVADNNV